MGESDSPPPPHCSPRSSVDRRRRSSSSSADLISDPLLSRVRGCVSLLTPRVPSRRRRRRRRGRHFVRGRSSTLPHPPQALNIPYRSKLTEKIEPGQTLIIRGRTPEEAKRFNINLHKDSPDFSGNDVPLHVSVRFDEGKVSVFQARSIALCLFATTTSRSSSGVLAVSMSQNTVRRPAFLCCSLGENKRRRARQRRPERKPTIPLLKSGARPLTRSKSAAAATRTHARTAHHPHPVTAATTCQLCTWWSIRQE
ncbi:galactoside-binding lectin [Ancylostoma duodenale]|uniref:Galectin n=1 Tax=Ancylostoma duodenale TaxID=51022 RepID=A0A0C2CQS0_9BILA|nr:galactoside-binding lectin [Ancylostoma duodenale]